MLRGPATINLWADDLEAAKAWYTELLGIEPYFLRENPMTGKVAYCEFRFGDYETELGLIDALFKPASPSTGPGGAIVNWAVDDVQAAFDRLLAMGCSEYEPVTERGPGFVTGSVVDPFGNILGVMWNVHYLEVLKAR